MPSNLIAGDAPDENENSSSPDNSPPEEQNESLGGLTENLGLEPATPHHDPLIGTTIGGVRIIRSIAEGGMGRVYEGLQDKPRRPVAVKVLRPGLVSREICRRFDNESELLGRLRHPHIAQIYSAGVCEVVGAHVPYFVMEFIPNAKPITEYVIDNKLETQQKLELFRKVCEAVAHGHEKGVIHRDLKPSNILVEPSGDPKVIDFGVARSVDTSPEQMTALTEIGQLVGTVQYMSPEQFSADPTEIDTRADVYALGVILYELLTGKPPYEIRREQIFAAAEVVRKQKPVSPSKLNRTVQPDVEKITGRCLQKDRTFRYANAAELKDALADYLGGKPVRDQNPGWRGSLISRARDWAKKIPVRVALGLVFACFVAMPGAWLLWAALSAPDAPLEGLEANRATDFTATPLRVAVNGLGGKDYVDPETFGPNWLGLNPKCSGEEKAWIEKESFAVIATKGAIAWPSVPANRYVCDFEITFTGHERDLKICFGDPLDADQIFFDYVAEREAVECSLRLWRHGSWGWYGHRDFEVNKRHVFRLVVGDGRQNLFAGGSLVLAEHNSWPTDCRLRIWSGTASGTIIHSLSFRPLTQADAEECGWEMPLVTVRGQPAIAANRIARLTEGLSDKPVAGNRLKAALVGSPLVWIKPGTFQMGSSRPDDVRRQTVTLTEGFWIGQTEVTQREYFQVMGVNPSRIGGSEYLPVDWVAWEDCETFCGRLNDAARKAGTLPDGFEYRLPTEAEWEYACRAGSEEDYSPSRAAVWDRDRSGRRPREVADSEPNAWGLYDMHGNAMEWCRDRWYEYPGRTVLSEQDPYRPGKPSSESFVVRGGSWWLAADMCSSHWRSLCTNTPAGGYRGFRIALAPIHEVIIDKTLVAWTTLENLEQRGGGVLSIEDPRNEFDAIVFGEASPFRWTIGSDWGQRAYPTPERAPLENAKPSELVQIAIVYSGSSIALYRNGVESVRYDSKKPPVPYRIADAKVVLGARHVPVPEDVLFNGELEDVRIYDFALTAEEILALKPNKMTGRKPIAWWHFEDGAITDVIGTFSNSQAFGNARVRGGRLVLDGRQGFVVCNCKTSPTSDELLKKQLVVDFLAPGARPGINGIPAEGKPLDLLKIADPTRDSVWGTWKRIGDELESGTEHNARIRFPVRPPREYEYRIEFTRLAGEECIAQCCTGLGAGFDCVIGANRNTIAGVERLDWRDVASSSSMQRRVAWITNGKRHTSTIRVRRDYLEVLFDGQNIISMPMDWSQVSQHPNWAIPDAMLGLGSWNSTTRFHRATVTDIGSITE